LKSPRPEISVLIDGLKKSDRIALGKAITLVESVLPADQEIAAGLIDQILPFTGNSTRIGITGVPGVGKSTFIETFGRHVTALNKRLAVLTIDPSSTLTKGSILGDKTRMEDLSRNNLAFIRPSASGTMLGGVTSSTRHAMMLCEAAGYDVIIVETVGVGQSEVDVKKMVDFFLLLMLAGAGDELQGIKKGITEMADAIVITKADGDNVARATRAKAEYEHALHLQTSSSPEWNAKVLTCSAFTGEGIKEIWQMIGDRIAKAKQSGAFEKTRQLQDISWLDESFRQLLEQDVRYRTVIERERSLLLQELAARNLSPRTAAKKLLERYHRSIREGQ
jgi:LAO/AO transport system kinase